MVHALYALRDMRGLDTRGNTWVTTFLDYFVMSSILTCFTNTQVMN